MLNKLIEKEFRYIIPRKNLKKILPKTVVNFILQSKSVKQIEDILLERKGKTLKSEDIGMRLRKLLDKSGTKVEFTYKKFLGQENGVARFDERNFEIKDKVFDEVVKGDLTNLYLPFEEYLSHYDSLFVLLRITNRRKVYNYTDGDAGVEVVVEDIKFFSGTKNTKDAMIEIEIKSTKDNITNCLAFAGEIKRIFHGEESNQGKNARGMFLLGIS